jgi:hypothetical protein
MAAKSKEDSEVISSSKGTPRRSNIVVPVDQLSPDNQSDYNKLKDYFTEAVLQEHVLPIILQKSTVSLRLLDWLVTNYAKAHACEYNLPSRVFPFNVHHSYRAKLSELQKSGFDPFCRDRRIYFPINDKQRLLTTIGQLNFFRWAIENQVLEFAKQHADEIEAHMNSADVRQAPKRLKSDGQPTKRRELSRPLPARASTFTGAFSLELQ